LKWRCDCCWQFHASARMFCASSALFNPTWAKKDGAMLLLRGSLIATRLSSRILEQILSSRQSLQILCAKDIRRTCRFVSSSSSSSSLLSPPSHRQGWVFSKRTCVLSGIQFTTHCIEFVVMQTKRIVRSNSNVILTRQTSGQSSGMAAGGKRRAIAFYFSVQIFSVFLMSKCRGELDPGLCMTSVLAVQCRLPILERVWPQDSSEVGTAQRHSLCKYRSHAQT